MEEHDVSPSNVFDCFRKETAKALRYFNVYEWVAVKIKTERDKSMNFC
jgi:hypothetical protein